MDPGDVSDQRRLRGVETTLRDQVDGAVQHQPGLAGHIGQPQVGTEPGLGVKLAPALPTRGGADRRGKLRQARIRLSQPRWGRSPVRGASGMRVGESASETGGVLNVGNPRGEPASLQPRLPTVHHLSHSSPLGGLCQPEQTCDLRSDGRWTAGLVEAHRLSSSKWRSSGSPAPHAKRSPAFSARSNAIDAAPSPGPETKSIRGSLA